MELVKSKPFSPRERFIRTCNRQVVDRPPVWMMRQAGRYLPEYREIRKQKSTLQMMQDPETACEITLQPVNRLGVDAAILYSDILIVPEAMGLKLDFVKDVGPVFDRAVTAISDVAALNEKNITERCPYVFETIRLLRKKLPNDFPLLGFAGSPFTVGAYMVGGDGSYDGTRIKKLAMNHKDVFRKLMEKLTLATIDYLKQQIRSGCDAVQLFDTWAGTLNIEDYEQFALPYTRAILKEINATDTPTILYIKGGGHLFEKMIEAGPKVVSIDWRLNLAEAKDRAQGRVAIQGNFDPTHLYASPEAVAEATKKMVETWNQTGPTPGYIANLGHGILEDVPVESAQAFINTVKNFQQ